VENARLLLKVKKIIQYIGDYSLHISVKNGSLIDYF